VITLEIVFTILGIIGALLVMQKRRCGWMVWNISNIIIIAHLAIKQSYVAAIPFVFYIGINTRAWMKWGGTS